MNGAITNTFHETMKTKQDDELPIKAVVFTDGFVEKGIGIETAQLQHQQQPLRHCRDDAPLEVFREENSKDAVLNFLQHLKQNFELPITLLVAIRDQHVKIFGNGVLSLEMNRETDEMLKVINKEIIRAHNVTLRKEALQKQCGKTCQCNADLEAAKSTCSLIKIQTDSAMNELNCLLEEEKQLNYELLMHETCIETESQKLKKAHQEHYNIKENSEYLRIALEERHKKLSDCELNMEHETRKNGAIITAGVQLELEKKQLGQQLLHAKKWAVVERRKLELSKRQFCRKTQVSNAVKSKIPDFVFQANDTHKMLASYLEEQHNETKYQIKIKNDADMTRAHFLRQENIENDKKHFLERLIEEIQMQQNDVLRWDAEEKKEAKIIAELAARRDLKNREILMLKERKEDYGKQNEIKLQVVQDLQKTGSMLAKSIAEVTQIYDMILNEREAVAIMTCSTSRLLDNLNQETKVLVVQLSSHEANNSEKKKSLQQRRDTCNVRRIDLCKSRDDHFKIQGELKVIEEAIGLQNFECRRSKSAFVLLRKNITLLCNLKQRCLLVDVQTSTNRLCERAKELELLRKKARVYECILKNADIPFQHLQRECHLLKISISETHRRKESLKKKMPLVSEAFKQIKQLQGELEAEMLTKGELSKNFENPENKERWRSSVSNKDPAAETDLQYEIEVIEKKISESKSIRFEREQCLSDLVIALDGLRKEIDISRRDKTSLVNELIHCQGKDKDLTKMMLSLTGELGMYQMTSEKSKHNRNTNLLG